MRWSLRPVSLAGAQLQPDTHSTSARPMCCRGAGPKGKQHGPSAGRRQRHRGDGLHRAASLPLPGLLRCGAAILKPVADRQAPPAPPERACLVAFQVGQPDEDAKGQVGAGGRPRVQLQLRPVACSWLIGGQQRVWVESTTGKCEGACAPSGPAPPSRLHVVGGPAADCTRGRSKPLRQTLASSLQRPAHDARPQSPAAATAAQTLGGTLLSRS